MAEPETQDAFLWFSTGTIQGESQDADMEGNNAMELLDFTVTAHNSVNIGSATKGGGGAGKVSFDRLVIRKRSDKATTGFFKALATNEHIDNAWIMMRRSGQPYIMIEFNLVLIAEMETSQGGDQEAEDSIVIDWGSVKIEYQEQDAKGKMKKVQEALWSRTKNKPEHKV